MSLCWKTRGQCRWRREARAEGAESSARLHPTNTTCVVQEVAALVQDRFLVCGASEPLMLSGHRVPSGEGLIRVSQTLGLTEPHCLGKELDP